MSTRLGIPAIDNDPSLRAVVGVLDRWDDLPVKEVLVWRITEDSNADVLRHVAQMLGLGDVDLSIGNPVELLQRGRYLKRRRGTRGALLASLEAAGHPAESVELVRDTVWRHDGTIDRSGSGEYLYGGDGHWSVFVARVQLGAETAWPTLDAMRSLWVAVNAAKSERDRAVVVVRRGTDLAGVYRDVPTSVRPEGVLEGALHRWRGDVAVLDDDHLASMPGLVGTLALTPVNDTVTATTVGGQPAWDLGASESGRFLEANFASALNLEAGSLFVVADVAGPALATAVLICTGRASALATEESILINYNGTFYARRVAGATGDLVLSEQIGTVAILLTWDAAGAELWVNGELEGSNATEAEPQPAGRLTIGALVGDTFAGGFKFAEAQLSNTRQSEEGIAALFSYAAARYGV